MFDCVRVICKEYDCRIGVCTVRAGIWLAKWAHLSIPLPFLIDDDVDGAFIARNIESTANSPYMYILIDLRVYHFRFLCT